MAGSAQESFNKPLPESFEVPVKTCRGIIIGKGPTIADANARVLAAIDEHNSQFHLQTGTPSCYKTWFNPRKTRWSKIPNG